MSIKSWSAAFSRLAHVWHEHQNFRAAEIRNRAILASSGEICIFLDGDCLALPGFIAAHRALAEYYARHGQAALAAEHQRRAGETR